MRNEFYTLPEINFVGGETNKYEFKLFRLNGTAYNLPDATASIAITEAVNRCGLPLIIKAVPISASESGDYNRILIELHSSDTVNISGKYIYQISIKDSVGRLSVPNQGVLYIAENINKSFIG